MIVSFKLNGFACPANMTGHLQKVFSGEYDIPLEGQFRILDLGANCGAFALWAHHRWPGSKIQCYEPHPETLKILEANVARYSGITVIPKAVGEPGFKPLFNGPNNCGEASLHHMTNNLAPTGQHVEVISSLSLPPADILKMDIEGCELEVLKPLIEAGRGFDAILLEFHNWVIRREIEALLAEDYILTRCDFAHSWERGTACYVNRRLVE